MKRKFLALILLFAPLLVHAQTASGQIQIGGAQVAANPSYVCSPLTIPFGTQQVNTVSAAFTSLCTSNGNALVNLTGVSITLGASNFAIVTVGGGVNNCTATTVLLPGQNCTLAVNFAPTTATCPSPPCSLTGTATVTATGATGSPQAISLTGTGVTGGGSGSALTAPNDTVGTQNITNTALTSNVATYTYTLNDGTVPFVGLPETIAGTTNGGGAFNVTNGVITAVTTSPQTFSIAITHANVSTAADTGTAQAHGYTNLPTSAVTIDDYAVHEDPNFTHCVSGTGTPTVPCTPSTGGLSGSAFTAFGTCGGNLLATNINVYETAHPIGAQSVLPANVSWFVPADGSLNIFDSTNTMINLPTSHGGHNVLVSFDPTTGACPDWIDDFGQSFPLSPGAGAFDMSYTQPNTLFGFGKTGTDLTIAKAVFPKSLWKISAISESASTATVTVVGAIAPLVNGTTVDIVGVPIAGYNTSPGVQVAISNVTGSTFQYTTGASGLGPSSGGWTGTHNISVVPTNLIDVTTNCGLPAGHTYTGGGGLGSSQDPLAAGVDNVLLSSVAVDGEIEGNWSLVVAYHQPTGGCGWINVKADSMGSNGLWPGGWPSCASACTGIHTTQGFHGSLVSTNGLYGIFTITGISCVSIGSPPFCSGSVNTQEILTLGTRTMTFANAAPWTYSGYGHFCDAGPYLLSFNSGNTAGKIGSIALNATTVMASNPFRLGAGSFTATYAFDQHCYGGSVNSAGVGTIYSNSFPNSSTCSKITNGTCAAPAGPGQTELLDILMGAPGSNQQTSFRHMHANMDYSANAFFVSNLFTGNGNQCTVAAQCFAVFSSNWQSTTAGPDDQGKIRTYVYWMERR